MFLLSSVAQLKKVKLYGIILCTYPHQRERCCKIYASILSFLPQQYIGLLELIPIRLGIKEIVCNFKRKSTDESDEQTQKAGGLVWSVLFVTVANGADNIGVYIPLFAGYAL